MPPIIKNWLRNTISSAHHMDQAAAHLYRAGGGTVPYEKLSRDARRQLRAEAAAVLESLIPCETVRVEEGPRAGLWVLTRTDERGCVETLRCIAPRRQEAAETALTIWPKAELEKTA